MTSVYSNALESCTLPESLVFGNSEKLLKFKAHENRQEVILGEVGFLAKLKGALAILIPGLMVGEIKIHLYDVQKAGFLARYDDIENTKHVKFFLACNDGDKYKVISGTVERGVENQPRDNSWSGYIGMTALLNDQTPDITLRANLNDFWR